MQRYLIFQTSDFMMLLMQIYKRDSQFFLCSFLKKGKKLIKQYTINKKIISNKKNKMKKARVMDTYVGKKGYTLQKSDLTCEEIKHLISSLTVTPNTNSPYGSSFGGGGAVESFPVYRETEDKYFVPKFFGTKYFGLPAINKLLEGTPIHEDIFFNGELREEQKKVVAVYMEHAEKRIHGIAGGMLEIPCGGGKTLIALFIFSILRLKTIVVVHKEFLVNQWIERIVEFLPGCRVGKIQGEVIDIEDKDIVIGMLQSLSMKQYDIKIFESFGLTIIDEVHHISSHVFSRALFKIVTNFTLGLSATMNRKDGTTDIFKMFLGEIIYKGVRDVVHDVKVHAYQYRAPLDEEFNNVITDYKGKVQFSSMISKLCAYEPRSDFIIRILDKMLKENPEQQIMIISHNRCLLNYLESKIKLLETSVGFYVGGMKKDDLKTSEGRQVILATYSMAAEALDIKTLTTLIMATPKTDIEQAVGRILREKHSSPIVVDIIDPHGLFQSQWQKRKKFYDLNHYTIMKTKL
jgi:superfamily II DNA or RNA helicase